MLIKRNLLIFFRDKANVFFSLLSVFIIIGLYVLFLGSVMEAGLRAQLGFDSALIGVVMSGMMLGGMVAVSSFTSCLGAASVGINDKDSKHGAEKDFLTSPLSRWKIVSGYVLSSAIISLIMTTVALVLCVIYLTLGDAGLLSVSNVLRLALTTVLSVLSANAIVFFITLFIKSQSAFSALSAAVGALIGFVMGIYIPIGQLPDAVGWLIRLFPLSHAASMYRQILADDALGELFTSLPPDALESFRESFGVVLVYGDVRSGFWLSAVVLLLTAALFYGLSLAVMGRRRGE